MAWMTESYEVVIIQYRLAETIRGKYYPAREVMPRAEQWGKYGFTPFNLELAEIKFDQLTQVTGLGKLDHMRVSLLG